jgi:hypothetical protein
MASEALTREGLLAVMAGLIAHTGRPVSTAEVLAAVRLNLGDGALPRTRVWTACSRAADAGLLARLVTHQGAGGMRYEAWWLPELGPPPAPPTSAQGSSATLVNALRAWFERQPTGSTWSTSDVADIVVAWTGAPDRDAVQRALTTLARLPESPITAHRSDHRGLITRVVGARCPTCRLWRDFRAA